MEEDDCPDADTSITDENSSEGKSTFLELVLLDGRTTFIPTIPGWTILAALTLAGFLQNLINMLRAVVNGACVPLSSVIDELHCLVVRLRAFPLRGGAPKHESATSKAKSSKDPWGGNDPWGSWTGTRTQPTKWDQLILAKNNPFRNGAGERLVQVCKLKLGAECGGIAMVTRVFLPTAITLTVPSPTVLLLPAMKELVHVDEKLKSKVLPPVEVVVEEPDNGKRYKRVVLPLVIKGPVKCECEEISSPSQVDAEPFAELALELQTRLCPPQLKSLVSESPLEAFRPAILAAKLEHEEMSMCAHRAFNAKEGEKVHQVLVKLPDHFRKAFLHASGLQGMFVREFMPLIKKVLDHAILPRYWNLDVDQLRQCRELGVSCQSFRGIALSAKGFGNSNRQCQNCGGSVGRAIKGSIRITGLSF